MEVNEKQWLNPAAAVAAPAAVEKLEKDLAAPAAVPAAAKYDPRVL